MRRSLLRCVRSNGTMGSVAPNAGNCSPPSTIRQKARHPSSFLAMATFEWIARIAGAIAFMERAKSNIFRLFKRFKFNDNPGRNVNAAAIRACAHSQSLDHMLFPFDRKFAPDTLLAHRERSISPSKKPRLLTAA